MDSLDFVRAERVGGRSQAARRYYDYLISGVALRSLIDPHDHIGVFGWLERAHETRFAKQLLRRAPSDLPSGRVPLYICPECADLGCGALSVRVIEDHDSFAWTDLGFETSFGDPPAEFLDVRAFYFPKREYDTAIRRFWPRGR
jgi:hypothetical protein